ncbi:FixH family protein [Pararhodobacter sp.]|uniref:FixH family protein n=1 Tax=Pararhodobacter sp. TaxID=2127056 RepID=UPI002AFE2D57|nr:FixH family protein [Pararhodobacter sp.]
MAKSGERELTGRGVLMITVGAFGVIIGVNLFMAYVAIDTFPGLEVRNSYVASQGFNERQASQRALGWTTEADLTAGRLRLAINNANGSIAAIDSLQVTLGRPTTAREDFMPEMRLEDGAYVADVDVDYGNWNLHIVAVAADGTDFTQRIGLIHHR